MTLCERCIHEDVCADSKECAESEKLYAEFLEWMKNKGVTSDKFRALFHRYYDEFIKEA